MVPQRVKMGVNPRQRFVLPKKHMYIGKYISRLRTFIQDGLMVYCDAEYVARSLPVIALPDIVQALNLSVVLFNLSPDMCQELLHYYCSLEWIDNFSDVLDIAAPIRSQGMCRATVLSATSYGTAYGDRFSMISAAITKCEDKWVFTKCAAIAV